MQGSPEHDRPKLNFSPFKADEITGRQAFLAGLYISLIILLTCPLQKIGWEVSGLAAIGGMDSEMSRHVAQMKTHQNIVLWVTFLLGAIIPAIVLVRRRAISRIVKVIALILLLPSILFAIRIVNDEGVQHNMMVSLTWGPTIWGWMHLAAQTSCAVGIFQFMTSKKEKIISTVVS